MPKSSNAPLFLFCTLHICYIMSHAHSALSGSVESCLLDGIRKRALGLFSQGTTTFSLLRKLGKLNVESAQHVLKIVKEIEAKLKLVLYSIYARICAIILAYVRTPTRLFTCSHAHMCLCICSHAPTYMLTRAPVYMLTRAYIHAHTRLYTCFHAVICMPIHAQMHTKANSP